MDKETKNAIIMEHYMNPMNRDTITDDKYMKINSNSETCIDDIDLYIQFEDNKIKGENLLYEYKRKYYYLLSKTNLISEQILN